MGVVESMYTSKDIPMSFPHPLRSPFLRRIGLVATLGGAVIACSSGADAASPKPATALPAVTVACEAELSGTGRTVSVRAASDAVRVAANAALPHADLALGRYALETALVAEVRDGGHQAHVWRVALTESGRPPASPIAHFHLDGLELATRKEPLVMRAYHFAEPAMAWEVDGRKVDVTRIDWTCTLSVTR